MSDGARRARPARGGRAAAASALARRAASAPSAAAVDGASGGFVVGLLIVVVVVAAVFVGSKLWHSFGPQNDYTGNGKQDLVIQVHAGDSTTAIGETLHNAGCGPTVKAFVEAADGNTAISSIQPGYYRMRTEIPAASAVQRLADPKQPGGQAGHPRRSAARRHHRRQDQRHDAGHLHP